MRIVRLSDLSEEEKKKALQEQQARLEANNQARANQIFEANAKFDEMVNKYGSADTNSHTYSLNNLRKNSSNDYWNSFKKSNSNLWNQIQEKATNNLKNTFETVWRGFTSGVKDVPYYLENLAEQNKLYKQNKEQQFLRSNNVSTEEKAQVDWKNLNSIISAKGNEELKEKTKEVKTEKVETNLLKRDLADSIQKDEERIAQLQKEIDDPVLSKVAEVAPSIGQMLPGKALSALNPMLGIAYFTASSGGNYTRDALNKGMNEREATLYGSLMGSLEGITELAGVENLAKAGRGVKTLIKGAGKEVVKETGKAGIKTILKDYGIGIADNVIQEAMMEPIQEIVAGVIGGKDKADYENIVQRTINAGINGGICSAIMGGAEMGIDSCVGLIEKVQNGQTPTQKEFQTATKDVNEKVNVENLIIESTQQEINKYNNNNNEISENLQNNLPQNTANTEVNKQIQQTTQQIKKVAENGMSRQIRNNVQNYNQNQLETQKPVITQQQLNDLKEQVTKNFTKEDRDFTIEYLNKNNVTNEDVKAIKNTIKASRENILNTNETYLTGRQQKYVKYMNQKSNFDTTSLEEAKQIIPGNRQGKRTKEQWLQVAEQIGNKIADKPVQEIEQIAYRTWQKEKPSTKESLNRQGQRYVKFTSDDWINTIYNAVKKIDEQNIQLNNEVNQVQDNQENNQIMNNFIQSEKQNVKRYEYRKSENIKVDNLRRDASKYFNNSEETQKYINILEKIIQDKDIEIRLDNTLTDENGKMANGKYQNGTITINPNSTRAGEFIAIHELTHAIGTKSMMNIIENYRKSNPKFDESVKKILENYNQSEITEESLADVSAELFGNQEFINNLSQENPSLFKRIYNEIKYLWHQFKGYKNQNQFIEDLQYKWEQAYRSNNELNNTTNYYIEPVAKFDELEYNNVKEVILPKQEYAILSSIVNSDSNIKPGINYVEVTNGKYTIYYKETGKFKVMSKEVDENAGKISKRNDTTRGEARYSKSPSEITENESSTGSNDEILNINSQGESERSRSNTSSTENIRNSIENSNQSSFSMQENIKEFDITNGLDDYNGTTSIFFDTTEKGYHVTATGKGGELINDATFIDKKGLTRHFGEELAEYIIQNSKVDNMEEVKVKANESKDYRMAHRPSELGANASDISNNGEVMPKDVYEHPEWYFDMTKEYSKESLEILKNIKGNPEAEITIYRATTGNKINEGDWVTLSKKYAEHHNNTQFNGEGNVVELRVKAKDVQFAGDDINEFGYFPENKSKVESFNVVEDNKGRKLTKEQQEFFKDSKVLDRNGNLLTLYHGTGNDFNIFNIERLGSGQKNAGNYGDGFYFTPSKYQANDYAKDGKIKEVYLDIKNPFIYSQLSEINGENIFSEFVDIYNLVKLNDEWGNIPIEYGSKQTWSDIKDAVQNFINTGEDINNIDEEMYKQFGELAEQGLNERIYMYAKNNGYKTLRETLKKKGYDGIFSDNVMSDNTQYVAFESNQIKNIDNSKPTDNPDIRYSKNNESWQEYLEKNFKTEGTRTDLQAIRLPTKENAIKAEQLKNTKQKIPNIPLSKNRRNIQQERYNKYKENIIKGKETQVNNLINYKNESVRSLENRISEKQELLNNKTNKDTKVATTLKTQIENLREQKNRIENLYNEKIDKINSKIDKKTIDLETRNMMKQSARETLKIEIEPLVQDLTKYKDKKMGIMFNRETAQRNIDDVVSDKDLATSIKETLFDPIQVHQAQKTRDINEYFREINNLKLDKTKKYKYIPKGETKSIKIDEATLAQLLIEKKITNTDLVRYGLNQKGINKINNTANTFSRILEELYNKMNDEQIKFGYSPIGKLENYFPHFQENKADTILGKIASKFNINISNRELPTEIAGKTDIFKPGKTWNSNTLKRKTNKTDYDALVAMEKYIQGATDIIYTTEDIQKLREYSKEIRYQYSEESIQSDIDKINNDSELTQEAKDASIEGIFEKIENPLPNFVTWLDDYTNTLAGKKAFADRNLEHQIGRNLYSGMSGIESRIASNTIGGNLSVSLTNFAPLFQSMGTTKVNYVMTGMLQTSANDIKNMIGREDTSFVDNSTFLTNRFGTDSISKKKITQKVSDFLSLPMNNIDEFVSESIVRAKYLENLDKGMSEEMALDSADKYTAKIMADRSKGALPIAFNSKNPFSKLVTMFQVEPNNIVSNYLKDMPRDAKNKTQLTYQAAKLMVASWAFNSIIMGIRGGNEVLPDPIRWITYLIEAITGDDDEKEKAMTDLSESFLSSVPFAGNVAGLFGAEEIGRIPISNAMPDVTKIGKIFDKELNSNYRKQVAQKEILKPLLYLGLPVGGAQLKKTVEGISTVNKGGSYTLNKEGETTLEYPVKDKSTGNYIKAGILGKSALKEASIYSDRDYKALNAKQTKIYEESGLEYNDLLQYIDETSKEGKDKIEDKINYINSSKMNEKQKWAIYKYDILSDKEREKDGGSQLSDAEYITSHGVTKTDYIKAYNQAKANKLDMLTKNEYKEIEGTGLSLNTYMDYKTRVKETTKKQKQEGTIEEEGQLKNKDKIQIIIDSKYSDKEKTVIYQKYINKEDIVFNKILSKDNINIDEYLKYKQQEFESDKQDDGTLSGKAISGTKKKKIYDYVNNMNISEIQKIALIGSQYKLTRPQQRQLYNYLNDNNNTKEENVEIFKKYSKNFVIYKDQTMSFK